MLNGTDITIPCSLNEQDQGTLVLNFLNRFWHKMVVEYEENKEHLEFYVYEDYKSKVSWDLNGRSEDNYDKMIHFIADNNKFYIIHESNLLFESLTS